MAQKRVVLTGDDRVLTRSAAVLFVLGALGGLWTIAARVGGPIVPRPAADALYDLVARWRKRLFAAPAEACPVVSPVLRARFLDRCIGAIAIQHVGNEIRYLLDLAPGLAKVA